MKQLFFSLLTLLLFTTGLSAQCFENGWSHPNIQGNTLRCVHALGDVIYTGGDAGTVLKSTDAGQTWDFVNIDAPYFILGIHFTDANTGFAATRQGVHKTTDGGVNWEFTQLSNSSWMNDVHFTSAMVGIVCGQNGLIYRTVDGGETWTNQNSWSNRHLYAVNFTDELNGFAVGGANDTSVGGVILKTVDGGISWSASSPLNQKINDVYFTSPQNGHCVCDFGRYLTTTDGGTSWTVSNFTNSQLLGIQFFDENSGIAVGTGTPWITVDGGTTWTERPVPNLGNAFWALSTPTAGQNIIVGGAGQIITGSELMATAQLRTEGATGNTLTDIVFKDDMNGMACGVGATLMHTSNGGDSWVLDTDWAFGQNFSALANTEAETAFLIGTQGRIRKSTDWGENWELLTSGVGSNLRSIHYINPDTIWVAGENGTLIRTYNAGVSWSPMDVGTSVDLNAVHFQSSGIGWVVGTSGSVFKSDDFGSTWESAYFGNSSQKKEIVFFNDSIGYAGGSTSTIYYTHDGGNTWSGSGSAATGAGVASILPLNASDAIAVGGFGLHYLTADSGKTWTEAPLIADNLMYRVYGQNGNIWSVGGEGMILKSGIGGAIEENYALDICAGDSVLVGNNWLSETGVYFDTIPGLCDTLLQVSLNVHSGGQSNVDAFICAGDSVFLEGEYQNTTGIYNDILTNQWGCDSLRSSFLEVLLPSDSTFSETICNGDSILFFGQYITDPGTYQDNSLTNTNGCDSLVTLSLEVLNPSFSNDVQSSCGSFTWTDGIVYTESNNSATQIFTNTAGCDSIVTLNLTILESTSGTDTQSACETYTWIDGNIYAENNNTATQLLTNTAGCDSLVTLNLTILESTSGTDTQSACETYTWIDGNIYTENNNTATHVLTNAAGCDSLVTLNLTILESTSGTDSQSACETFTWIDGNTYTENNNTAMFTLVNAAGCDSLVTLDLTVNTINVSVNQSGPTLTAELEGATYQWLNCDDNFEFIVGENNQNFTATSNGNYAVQITQNGCVSLSECISVLDISIVENEFGQDFLIYPNPTEGPFKIDLGDSFDKINIVISDSSGRLVFSETVVNQQLLALDFKEPAGLYFMKIEAGDKMAKVRLVRQ